MESGIVYKKCSKCKEVKPIEEFHNDKTRADGHRNWCRICAVKHRRQYYKDNKDAIAQYYEDNKEAIAKYGRQYRKDNKDIVAERNKQYYEGNKDTIAEKHKQYYEGNKDTIAERKKQYYEGNKDTIAEKHKRYYKTFLGRKAIKAGSQNRRARKKKAEGKITKTVVLQVEENNRQEYGKLACVYCGAAVSDDYHLDHRVPLARGGDNTIENLAIACPTCNLRKHTKTDEEFLEELQKYPPNN